MSAQWEQVKQLFDQALERDATLRPRFLREACAGDESLYREVSSLLDAFATAGGTLDRPPFQSSLLESAAEQLKDRVIGSYRIVRRLGEGGMGVVYLATRADDQFRKTVAVKVVTPGPQGTEVLQRFLTERQTLAALDHPNIVKLLDGGTTDDGLAYLTMDYVKGQPIDEYCESHGLSVVERLQLFRQVCAGVHYAHQNLVVHRDIKPSNILVTPEGVPKLLDFGIAKLLKSEYSFQPAGLTRTRAQPLTPEYASPEQIRGQPITTGTDIYSLGVLLYKLLTDQHPFQARTYSTVELERAICDEDPELPSRAKTRQDGKKAAAGKSIGSQGSLSREVDMIVLMAMRKEPQRRYASVEQFSDDVQRYLANLPVLACRDTRRYRLRKFIKRHEAGVAAAALITLALLTSTIVSMWYARAAQAEKLRAERGFHDVRQLAEFLLFDFDDAMRSGPTSARKNAVGRGLEAIRRLAQEAPDDSLQRDLMEAYIRIGDLQGNLYGPSVGDLNSAAESYRNALDIAESMYRQYPTDPKALRNLARAHQKMGEVLALQGNQELALQRYQRALKAFGSLAGTDTETQLARDLVVLYERLGFTHYELGDLTTALAEYDRYLSTAQKLLAAYPDDLQARRAVAKGSLRSGEIEASCGNGRKGLQKVRRAVSSYQQLAAVDPDNTLLQRDLASAYLVLGDVVAEAGSRSAAIESYRRGLKLTENLQRNDPENTQLQRDLYLARSFLASLLAQAGEKLQARRLTEDGLSVARTLSQQRQASPDDHRNYAWLLLTTPFQDLQNPREAKRHAEAAVSLSSGNDPAVLHTLALALEGTGELTKAIEIEQRALSLRPAITGDTCVPHMWKELDRTLARLTGKLGRSALSQKPQQAKT